VTSRIINCIVLGMSALSYDIAELFRRNNYLSPFVFSPIYLVLNMPSVYRYFKFELYKKKVIMKANLPPFFSTWLDCISLDYMFTPSQLKKWPTGHLQSRAWYLDCNRGVFTL